ncbi:MAG: class I SAM-dependent methyltransferase [Deltaproteobacteria bacterium]|nr:class I SAM-dependent methyltransferase [Deltaproteobacteria bacterium]MBI3388735.1 class I SAM-dependent methyltransferase [Deltaproteobacteria bacterium]
MGLVNDPRLEALLDRLHALSTGQNETVVSYFMKKAQEGTLDWSGFDEDTHRFMSDKFIALDRDKAELCYQLCRALRAKRIVEAGTSFGVSSLYLAAAVRDNVHDDGGAGLVIGTEHEPQKAKIARGHFAEAGLSDWIDLREGDLRQTLKDVGGPVDFMLIDIWTPMARPALELVAPALRPGAIIVCDNTTQFRDAYREYFEFVNDPKNSLRTVTLPFEGGFELTVRQ